MTTKAAIRPARRTRRATSAAPAPPTREVILDTAERLFAERGVDGVALRDLAREMGLTAPSLYNHFPSKQALYDAVLQRGLQPILEAVAEAWHPGALRPEQLRATVNKLTSHLAAHPHLARLLQRALLEESSQKLIARWLAPVYEEGVAVIRESAAESGWEPEEIPHLTLSLFGMVFAYFTNAEALRAFIGGGDPMTEQALAVQRRMIEKAIYRLLGPRAGERKKKA